MKKKMENEENRMNDLLDYSQISQTGKQNQDYIFKQGRTGKSAGSTDHSKILLFT